MAEAIVGFVFMFFFYVGVIDVVQMTTRKVRAIRRRPTYGRGK